MIQEVKQTKEEKVEMYMKCTKKQLAQMLAERDIIYSQSGLSYNTTPMIRIYDNQS